MDKQLKYKVISLLQQPTLTARMIAEELDISYSSILRVEKEFEAAKLNGTLDQLVDADEGVLMAAADVLEVDQAALTTGLQGVDKLNMELQATALQLNTRVRSLVMSAEHLSELDIAADIICNLSKAFNPVGTQVNVQNNFGGETNAASRYDKYLSDVPAKQA